MFDDVVKAITQMFSPPLRAILWKAIGLAVVLIILVAIVFERLIIWLLDALGSSLETGVGSSAHLPLSILAWTLSIAAGLGIIAGSVVLMPAVTAFVASFFADQIAEEVERADYPDDPRGTALPLPQAVLQGGKTAVLALLVYLCAIPFLLFAGAGAVLFFLATAWLLGREYFELAAIRFHSPEEARALRRRNAGTIYIAGLLIAAFVSIPIVNLATPLFAVGLMVHVHKRLGAGRSVALQTR
jgi:CysZ protein